MKLSNKQAYMKAYYKANVEQKKAYYKAHGNAYHKANIEQRRAYSRAYYKANAEQRKAYRQAYHQANVERTVWHNMLRRCTNPKDGAYKDYGGRGITICQRWLDSFEAFKEDMGNRPTPKHQIDRIDNDGNYEPDNCKWSTPKEQANNRR